MRINNNLDETKRFSEVMVGDIFALNGDYYLKIDTVFDIEEDEINAINLSRNYVESLFSDTYVIPYPNAELLITK